MQITIDGKTVSAESDETILDVARREGIDIPTLCFLKRFAEKPSTSCLVCIVKTQGKFVPSCATKVVNGMIIESETDEVNSLRRSALELLLSDHIETCRTCGDGRKKCQLLKYLARYKADRKRFDETKTESLLNEDEPVMKSSRIVWDSRKCIKCGICVAVTKANNTGLGLTFLRRGFDIRIGVPFDESLESATAHCADELIECCPTAAITSVS